MGKLRNKNLMIYEKKRRVNIYHGSSDNKSWVCLMSFKKPKKNKPKSAKKKCGISECQQIDSSYHTIFCSIMQIVESVPSEKLEIVNVGKKLTKLKKMRYDMPVCKFQWKSRYEVKKRGVSDIMEDKDIIEEEFSMQDFKNGNIKTEFEILESILIEDSNDWTVKAEDVESEEGSMAGNVSEDSNWSMNQSVVSEKPPPTRIDELLRSDDTTTKCKIDVEDIVEMTSESVLKGKAEMEEVSSVSELNAVSINPLPIIKIEDVKSEDSEFKLEEDLIIKVEDGVPDLLMECKNSLGVVMEEPLPMVSIPKEFIQINDGDIKHLKEKTKVDNVFQKDDLIPVSVKNYCESSDEVPLEGFVLEEDLSMEDSNQSLVSDDKKQTKCNTANQTNNLVIPFEKFTSKKNDIVEVAYSEEEEADSGLCEDAVSDKDCSTQTEDTMIEMYHIEEHSEDTGMLKFIRLIESSPAQTEKEMLQIMEDSNFLNYGDELREEHEMLEEGSTVLIDGYAELPPVSPENEMFEMINLEDDLNVNAGFSSVSPENEMFEMIHIEDDLNVKTENEMFEMINLEEDLNEFIITQNSSMQTGESDSSESKSVGVGIDYFSFFLKQRSSTNNLKDSAMQTEDENNPTDSAMTGNSENEVNSTDTFIDSDEIIENEAEYTENEVNSTDTFIDSGKAKDTENIVNLTDEAETTVNSSDDIDNSGNEVNSTDTFTEAETPDNTVSSTNECENPEDIVSSTDTFELVEHPRNKVNSTNTFTRDEHTENEQNPKHSEQTENESDFVDTDIAENESRNPVNTENAENKSNIRDADDVNLDLIDSLSEDFSRSGISDYMYQAMQDSDIHNNDIHFNRMNYVTTPPITFDTMSYEDDILPMFQHVYLPDFFEPVLPPYIDYTLVNRSYRANPEQYIDYTLVNRPSTCHQAHRQRQLQFLNTPPTCQQFYRAFKDVEPNENSIAVNIISCFRRRNSNVLSFFDIYNAMKALIPGISMSSVHESLKKHPQLFKNKKVHGSLIQHYELNIKKNRKRRYCRRKNTNMTWKDIIRTVLGCECLTFTELCREIEKNFPVGGEWKLSVSKILSDNFDKYGDYWFIR